MGKHSVGIDIGTNGIKVAIGYENNRIDRFSTSKGRNAATSSDLMIISLITGTVSMIGSHLNRSTGIPPIIEKLNLVVGVPGLLPSDEARRQEIETGVRNDIENVGIAVHHLWIGPNWGPAFHYMCKNSKKKNGLIISAGNGCSIAQQVEDTNGDLKWQRFAYGPEIGDIAGGDRLGRHAGELLMSYMDIMIHQYEPKLLTIMKTILASSSMPWSVDGIAKWFNDHSAKAAVPFFLKAAALEHKAGGGDNADCLHFLNTELDRLVSKTIDLLPASIDDETGGHPVGLTGGLITDRSGIYKTLLIEKLVRKAPFKLQIIDSIDAALGAMFMARDGITI